MGKYQNKEIEKFKDGDYCWIITGKKLSNAKINFKPVESENITLYLESSIRENA